MDEEMISDFFLVFNIFDDNRSGAINSFEITKVLQAFGENMSQAKAQKLIEQIDYNNDGEIDFDEFICMMVKRLHENDSIEEELVTVFKRFDKDGDGEIGVDDLVDMMRELGHNIEEQEAQDMIFCIDKDEDGTINFEEFV